MPDYWARVLDPLRPPDARPVQRGPVFATVQEMLALVGAGKGVYPFPAPAARYYIRPDVAFVPIVDAPPFEWVLLWRGTEETSRVRAFTRAAQDLLASGRAGVSA